MAAEKNRRARRIASISVLVVALVFIALSAGQIAAGAFGHPPPPKTPTPEEAACGARLRAMEAALERGALAATPAADESHALAAFAGALGPEWNDPTSAETLCSSSPRGQEAWAALLRLRRGLEGKARKDAHEIGPLRRDFETRLP